MTCAVCEDECYYICHAGRELCHIRMESKAQDGYTQTVEGYGSVPAFQKSFCQAEGRLKVPEADIAGGQIFRRSVQKNDGNLIVQDMCLKKSGILGLAGNQQKPGSILRDKFINFRTFNIRGAVGKGHIDRITVNLKKSGKSVEDFRWRTDSSCPAG